MNTFLFFCVFIVCQVRYSQGDSVFYLNLKTIENGNCLTRVDSIAKNALQNPPLILFSTGFHSVTPSRFYSNMVNTLKEYDYQIYIIQYLLCDPLQTNTPIFTTALDSISDEYHNTYNDRPKTTIFGCHSSGCDVMTQYLHKHRNGADGIFLISPVAGDGPLVTPKKDFWLQRQIYVPSVVLAGSLDSHNSIGVSCAPAGMSNEIFYDSSLGPSWYIEAEDYGHLDVFDHLPVISHFTKRICPSSDNQEQEVYPTYLGYSVSSFVQMIHNNETMKTLLTNETYIKETFDIILNDVMFKNSTLSTRGLI